MKNVFIKLILGFLLVLAIFLIPKPHTSYSFFDPAKVSGRNVYVQCDASYFGDKVYSCYKEAALYAVEHGYSSMELASFEKTAKMPHLLEHSIGRALILTSNYNLEKARGKCVPKCTEPYYHAFAEEMSAHSPGSIEEFKSFLTKYCPLDQDARVACYHTLGHFYLGATKNLGESFKLCDQFSREDQFTQCAYGTVHEQFIEFGEDHFFTECAKFSGRIKAQCFAIGSRLYPLMHPRVDPQDPLKLCNDASAQIPLEFNHCYRAFTQVVKDRGGSPVVSWCDSVNSEFRQLCIYGINNPEPFWNILGCSISEDNDGSFDCGTN